MDIGKIDVAQEQREKINEIKDKIDKINNKFFLELLNERMVNNLIYNIENEILIPAQERGDIDNYIFLFNNTDTNKGIYILYDDNNLKIILQKYHYDDVIITIRMN